MVLRIAHAARIGRESLAFSYFLLEPPAGRPRAEQGTTAQASPRYRVVSERFLAKSGRLRVLLCGPDGRFPLSVDGRASFSSVRTFRSLGRYDLVKIEGTEQRTTGWGLTASSVLEVVGRAPVLAEQPGRGTKQPPGAPGMRAGQRRRGR